MATLGRTARPTYGYAYEGYANDSQFFMALTLPAGGPWKITAVNCWLRGDSSHFGNTSTRLKLWDNAGNVLMNGGAFFPATAAYHTASVLYTAACSVVVSGGTTVKAGWAYLRQSGNGVQFDLGPAGNHYQGTGDRDNAISGSHTHTNGELGIYITYELANQVPYAPTPSSPGNGTWQSSQTPTLDFIHSDPDGDAANYYQVQVSTDPTFAVVNGWDSGSVATSAASGSHITVTPGALTRSTYWYWRARTSDAVSGWGPYSSAVGFGVYGIPTNSMATPASGQFFRLYYTAGSNTTPKCDVDWNYSCPDGHAQASAVVTIYADSGGLQGAQVYQTTLTQSGQQAYLSGFTPTNGTYYWIAVQCTCAVGMTAALSTVVRTRARWGRASYYYNCGAVTGWQAPTPGTTIPANSAMVLEYAGSTTTAEPSTWYADIGSVPVSSTYIWHRVTMWAWGSSPSSPSLNDMTLNWQTSVSTLDAWTGLTSYWVIDRGAAVYGHQSIRATGTGTIHYIQQVVNVQPNTVYTLQGRMKSSGSGSNNSWIEAADPSGGFAACPAQTNTSNVWERFTVKFNSGGRTQVTINLVSNAAVGVYTNFDALKLEASAIVNPWSPGYVGQAAVVDAGGIQIDGSGGGVLRLMAGRGTVRDQILLDSTAGSGQGLIFGGDVKLHSPAAGALQIFSTTPADDALWIGDDSILFDVDIADRLGVKGQQNAANGGFVFGSAKDTNLYRWSASMLATDGSFFVNAGANQYFYARGPSNSSVPGSPAMYLDNNGGSQTVLQFQTGGVNRAFMRADGSGNIILSPAAGGGTYLSWDNGGPIHLGSGTQLYGATSPGSTNPGLPYAMCSGKVNVSVSASNTGGPVAVSFPTGLFTQTPVIFINNEYTGSGFNVWKGAAVSASSTGFNAWVASMGGQTVTATMTLEWVAIQMVNSGNGTG